MILKEWKCPLHGTFESSDPICPSMGCESEGIERVFLTPPKIRHSSTTFTDQSFKDLATAYKLPDINNKDGQPAKNAADDCKWGMDAIGGVDNWKAATANGNQIEQFQTASGKMVAVDNMGMRVACQQSKLDQKVLPAAKTTITATDAKDRQKVLKGD